VVNYWTINSKGVLRNTDAEASMVSLRCRTWCVGYRDRHTVVKSLKPFIWCIPNESTAYWKGNEARRTWIETAYR